MAERIRQGETWKYEVVITEDGDTMNCLGHTCKMWIKRIPEESVDNIQLLTINWTDRSSGEGYFQLTHDMSKEMLGLYWFQVILYETDSKSLVQSLKWDKLVIGITLEKDL